MATLDVLEVSVSVPQADASLEILSVSVSVPAEPTLDILEVAVSVSQTDFYRRIRIGDMWIPVTHWRRSASNMWRTP